MLKHARLNSRTRWVMGICLWTCVPCALADYPTTVLDDEPLGYWRLNDYQVNTAPNAGSVGSSWDGTYHGGELGLSGPTELADGQRLQGMGANSGSFSVGGLNSYLSVPGPVLSNRTEFTFSGWIFPDSRDEDRIGLWGQNDVVEFGFPQPNQLQLWTAEGGSLEWNFDPDTELPHQEWFHVAATGDGQQLRLYVNGELVATGGTATSATYGSGPAPFRAGGGGIFDASGNQFRGLLSEIAVWDRALSAERLAHHFQAAIGGNIPGDFNGDSLIDAQDIDLLSRAILEASLDSLYDVDQNGVVDEFDHFHWVSILKQTWIGDANLDGEFSSADFVVVFQSGEYEDDTPGNSGWAEGDWDGDLDFTTADFVAAFNDGGYELGPRAIPAVPEPATGLLLVTGLGCLYHGRRRTQNVSTASTASNN